MHDLADRHGVNLEGALTWAFEFEDQPYFAGFRALATNGIDLPVLNVFRMFSRMGGERVAATSDGAVRSTRSSRTACATARTSARSRAARRQVRVLVWHYHDDDVPGPEAEVHLNLEGLPARERRGAAAALPDRRRTQQCVHRVAADGIPAPTPAQRAEARTREPARGHARRRGPWPSPPRGPLYHLHPAAPGRVVVRHRDVIDPFPTRPSSSWTGQGIRDRPRPRACRQQRRSPALMGKPNAHSAPRARPPAPDSAYAFCSIPSRTPGSVFTP